MPLTHLADIESREVDLQTEQLENPLSSLHSLIDFIASMVEPTRTLMTMPSTTNKKDLSALIENVDQLQTAFAQFMKQQNEDSAIRLSVTFNKVYPLFANHKQIQQLGDFNSPTLYYPYTRKLINELPKIYGTASISYTDKIIFAIRDNACNNLRLLHNKYSLICSLNQIANPIIRYTGGFCYGIDLAGAYDILKNNKFFGVHLTASDSKINFEKNQLPEKDLLFIEQCQMNSHVVTKSNNDPSQNDPRIISILPTTSFNFTRARSASNIIAKQVATLIKKINPSNIEAALAISLNGNIENADGHDLAIVIKRGDYFLIDSNTGVFKFNSVQDLQHVLASLLYEMKYAHVFNKFSIENYPSFESEFPTPEAWKPCIRQKQLELLPRQSKCEMPKQALNWMRDKFGEVYGVTSTYADLAKKKYSASSGKLKAS